MAASSYSMADISKMLGTNIVPEAKSSTSRKGNTELKMEDFLKLMITQLQSQTIDDTMDTGEMMNQMVQMQMITAITNLNDLSVMTYAGSLVNKVVTVGVQNGANLDLREVLVSGTGLMNGEQVIFGTDSEGKTQTYSLSQILSIGHLPEIEGTNQPEGGEEKPEGTTDNPADAPQNGQQTANDPKDEEPYVEPAGSVG